jgi:hypothetical protein
MMTPDAHAARAVKLLEHAEGASRTDPRRDQDARLANVHALLGIYRLLEQLATPRVVVDPWTANPLDGS